MAEDLPVTEHLIIPGADLSWTAVRATGPGGQNVNKVATKVDLRFDLESSAALEPQVKDRLRSLAAGRLDSSGRVVVTSQAGRTQAANLEDARQKLRALVLEALEAPKKRRATRPSRAATERRLEEKRRLAARKRSRSRVDTDEG